MTGQQINRDRLRALAGKATEGPWETFKTSRGRDNGIGSASPTVPSDEAVMEDAWSDPADAAFIVAARNALPQILDQLEQADARIKAVRDVLDAAEDRGPIGLTFDGTPFPAFVSSATIRRALEG